VGLPGVLQLREREDNMLQDFSTLLSVLKHEDSW